MKPIRFILLIMSIAMATSALAQAPQRFNYQAVARDASGNPLSEKSLAVRISIIDGSPGGASVYSETFGATTSKQGLFSIQVGGGTAVSGAFSSVVWGPSPKYLKVEIDPAGGSSFVLLGTSQLLSVPYALAADRLVTPMSIKDLDDVSEAVPTTGQVLKWNGTEWTPGTGSSLTTSTVLTGDGSAASPLTIAQQSATNGQVLQWNGSTWQPATVSGGVGDNWGTQNVVHNATLTGNGTAASQLALAQQGATTGQILKWSGSAWAPAADAGDNWGTSKVNTSTQFEGDGTPVSPLKLAQQSASVGQFLKWSGTTWVPGDGGGGSITFPVGTNQGSIPALLNLTNSTGTAIWGTNTSNVAGEHGVRGTILSSTGANTSGVYGAHGSTGTNGYGVWGQHGGNGVGVMGEAVGATGIAVNGRANGTSGIGVYGGSTGASGVGIVGLGNTGVNGTSNTAAGNGIYGNATGGGFAGAFDERVRISFNSTLARPTLNLNENETGDRSRLRFSNNVVGQYWDISAMNSTVGVDQDRLGIVNGSQGEILTVSGAGYVGISNVNPTQRLDVNGNIKLSGGIMIGASVGSNGQVLTSNGTVTQWGSATNVLYNNTYFYDQDATLSNISATSNTLSGLNNMSITLPGPSRVIITFSQGQLVSNGTGDVDLEVVVGFTNAAGNTIINRAVLNDVIHNWKKKSISFTHHCFFGTGGQYLPYVSVGKVGGGNFNAVHTNGAGQVSIQVIPQ